MKTDYYIASRYRNKDEVLELASKVRSRGKSVYCFIESEASLRSAGSLDENAAEVIAKLEAVTNFHTDPKIRDIFESDIAALKNADTVLFLLPCGNSAHTEAGVAYGLGKKLIMIGTPEKTETLYLIFSEFYSTIDEFINSINT